MEIPQGNMYLKSFAEIEYYGLVTFAKGVINRKIRVGCLAEFNTHARSCCRMPGFEHGPGSTDGINI